MTIKEVESILNIPKATVRFYEKEGLLNPQRGDNRYRQYGEEDIERLKKIIVLRKTGIGVEMIRSVLDGENTLQQALEQTVSQLEQQRQEIEGAIKVCRMMQTKREDIGSFDADYYRNMICAEEAKGSRFFELVNDIAEFEKQVVFEEFGLADEQGRLKFSPIKAVLIALSTCLAIGAVWFFMDSMRVGAFAEGFFLPLGCIVISSAVGLPLHFLEKKNKRAADTIKKVGRGIGAALLIAVLLWMMVEALCG